MRIATVGGGPGGLYCSLLLKKINPSLDVTLFEKNPRGATYGWGVVFSEVTLSSFREADYRTYVQIIDDFVIWDAIDVRYRDEVVRCGGQVFSGIARKRLLAILQTRCLELGVDLRFETEAAARELNDFDLVIAADGVHSLLRAEHADRFRPRLVEGASRYIWYGTDCPLDSFTFIFRTGEHGLFQVHAYPFDGTTSTFIVECSETVWRAAGLDAATESESIDYCEALFAEELRGHDLMSNESKWIRFGTLTNRQWHHNNVVLLGDAAHTAHFSIGSGTKLAMEDAVSLVNSLDTHEDLDTALADYQLERKPVVERFQEAARRSQSYFESTSRYAHLDTEQFVFHLLTRSGRIDYSNLRTRDPHLLERVDRWFADPPVVVAPPPAFTPLRLAQLELANRVALEGPPCYEGREGLLDEAGRASLETALSGGAGMVLTGHIAVSAHGRITPGCAGLYNEAHVAPWARLAQVAHATGTRLALRLNHSGRRGATRHRRHGLDRPLRTDGWGLLAPSPLAYGRNVVPFDLAQHIDDVSGDFAAAARSAAGAGIDVLIVEMGRGYLLGCCISPLTNLRDDDFGGSLEARLRWPLQIFDAVRAAWGKRPLGASICASDWAPSGASIEDAVEVTGALVAHGCDLVEVTAGHTTPDMRPQLDPDVLTSYSDRIRNECGVATLVGGDITTVDRVSTIIGGGRADVCLLRTGRKTRPA